MLTDEIDLPSLLPLHPPLLTLPYLTLSTLPYLISPSPSLPYSTHPLPLHPSLPTLSLLTPHPPQVTDLSTDMADGLVLITLMEQLRGKKIHTRLEPG